MKTRDYKDYDITIRIKVGKYNTLVRKSYNYYMLVYFVTSLLYYFIFQETPGNLYFLIMLLTIPFYARYLSPHSNKINLLKADIRCSIK